MKEDKQAIYEIPKEGSLGLLALGYAGLIAWRKAKDENMHKAENRPDEG